MYKLGYKTGMSVKIQMLSFKGVILMDVENINKISQNRSAVIYTFFFYHSSLLDILVSTHNKIHNKQKYS